MKPPLLSLSPVRTENGFPGERTGARQRVIVNEKRIIDAVKLNRLAQRGIDYFRLAENRSFMAANIIEPVKSPHYALGLLLHNCHVARSELCCSQDGQCRDTVADKE